MEIIIAFVLGVAAALLNMAVCRWIHEDDVRRFEPDDNVLRLTVDDTMRQMQQLFAYDGGIGNDSIKRNREKEDNEEERDG